jgi:hypothetical protein
MALSHFGGCSERSKMPSEKIKVLYIGGYGRSGSTLLAQLLGQIQGFHSVGEMWNIWQRCFIENQLCGCGKPFRQCEFWGAVIEEAFGGFDQVALKEINDLSRLMRSPQYLLPLTFPKLRTAQQHKKISAYLSILRRLYVAIHQVSGGRVIVDASKGPRYAMLLNEIEEIDLRIVHLVRDSRGVVYSWQKKRIKPEVYWKTEYMDQLNPTSAALIWNVTNYFMQTFRERGAAYIFMRYEDLITSPRSGLARLLEFAGESAQTAYPVESDGAMSYTATRIEHSAGGNPSRYRQGSVTLRQDDEWRNKMPETQKYLVTALTRPLLRKYGYTSHLRNSMQPDVAVESHSTLNESALSENGRSI